MMEVIDGQGRLPCSDARLLLEKTVAEESLSDGEQHLLDAHLTECGRCRDLHKLTFGLSLFAEAADSELDARISAVTEGLRREREAAKRRRTWWAAAGVAAAVLAVIAVGRWSMREPAGLEGGAVRGISMCRRRPDRSGGGRLDEPLRRFGAEDRAVRVVLKEGAAALYVNPLTTR